MIKEVKLPEIADNVKSATVLEVLVKVGQKVEKDDPLAEMESDKATFELPSETAGVVKEIKVGKGEDVEVGKVMFTIVTEVSEAEQKEEVEAGGTEDETEETEEKEHAEKSDEPDPSEKAEKKEQKEEKESEDESRPEEQPEKKPEKKPDQSDVPASPSVRRYSREIGIDISRVNGTGPGGRITIEDVKSFAKKTIESGGPASSDDYELPDFTKLGAVRREKIDTIRRITAKTLTESWQTIPHVFHFDKADITELENFRTKYSKQAEKKGIKLTVTALLLKLTAEALKKFPRFNASLDIKNEEIIYKEYVNIGVAVDTDRGLLVPVIRDADKKSITELSLELNELAEKARNKKLMPADLQGGNFAISNLGGIGGTNFTPIVYRPNVAILGVSRSQTEPVYIDGEFKPRMMLPLTISYDHRAIDGADGARFLRWLCEALENPLLTMF